MGDWLSEPSLGDISDLLSSLASFILLRNVFKLRSTAGISENYLIIGMTISIVQLIDASINGRISRVIIELMLIGSTVLVYATVTRMFPARSERFHDNTKTLLFVSGICVALSLTAAFDGNYLRIFVQWMNSLRLYCQYAFTMSCRRTTHFNWSFVLALVASQFVRTCAFIKASFTETGISVMCNFWLAGIVNALITVDFVFAVFNVRDTPDAFALLPK